MYQVADIERPGGIFREDERLELLDGFLVVREPQGSRHGAAGVAVQHALARAFGTGFHVRPQLPLAVDDTSEPEPDAVVVRGGPWDYASGHPSTPLLVVEIAETSLALDRGAKASLYARAGIADYWIVNLADAAVEVHRDPTPAGYRTIERLARGAAIAPLAAPAAAGAVSDLLPPA